MRACGREPVDATPVWFMRQAGRYLPGYQEVRRTHGVLEIAGTPELAAKVTLEPARALGVDAAILFADITSPLPAMGFGIRIEEHVGPVAPDPIRAAEDVLRLRPFDAASMGHVSEAVRLVKAKLGGLPLIGFCGAPFTLASYMIEGGGKRDLHQTKAFMWRHPRAWDELLKGLAEGMGAYLRLQADAGADALQVFDTWAGALAPRDFEERVLPATRALFRAARESGVPLIYFGTATGEILPLMRSTGAQVIGVDWRIPLDEAWRRLGEGVALQGNLDPAVLLAGPEDVKVRTAEVLERAGGRPGHIFNLGHGVLPGTPVEHARLVVEAVHAATARGG